MLVCPSTFALKASKLGGIEATFESVASLPTSPTAAQKAKRYYLTADDTASGFQKGTVVEWSEDIDDWKEFEGLVRA